LFAACLWPALCPAAEEPTATEVRKAVLDPPLSDLERPLFAEIHDGRLGRFTLLEAGLIAGGVQRGEELHRYRRRFDSLVQSLRSSDKVRGAPREQAEAIFTFLHKAVLHGGYCLEASDLRQAFDRGRFNCVTATLLLNCLAERFHLKAAALELPGHAMSRLELPEETLDIETTCPEWFKVSGTLRVPDTLPRQINEVELVAAVYYNRGIDLLAAGRFADAAAANAKAVRLDPHNAAAKGNYLATINNWGIELATAGLYPAAAELFRLGMAANSSSEAFRANYVRLLIRWSEKLYREGQDEEAIRLLHEADRELSGERLLREAAIEILRRRSEAK
jgi:tetratricopeptide (TPR) repeat protein